MKKIMFSVLVACLLVAGLTAGRRMFRGGDGFTTGDPGIRSISALAFGPDGILLIGDSKSAAIVAIDTKDAARNDKPEAGEVKNLDQQIAALLGTTAQNLTITDIAVNPVSKNVYCAVQSGDGTPVLLKIAG